MFLRCESGFRICGKMADMRIFWRFLKRTLWAVIVALVGGFIPWTCNIFLKDAFKQAVKGLADKNEVSAAVYTLLAIAAANPIAASLLLVVLVVSGAAIYSAVQVRQHGGPEGASHHEARTDALKEQVDDLTRERDRLRLENDRINQHRIDLLGSTIVDLKAQSCEPAEIRALRDHTKAASPPELEEKIDAGIVADRETLKALQAVLPSAAITDLKIQQFRSGFTWKYDELLIAFHQWGLNPEHRFLDHALEKIHAQLREDAYALFYQVQRDSKIIRSTAGGDLRGFEPLEQNTAEKEEHQNEVWEKATKVCTVYGELIDAARRTFAGVPVTQPAEIAPVRLIIDPASVVKLSTISGGGYILDSQLKLRFENSGGKVAIAKSLHFDLIERTGSSERVVPIPEVAHYILKDRTSNVVRFRDLPIPENVTEWYINAKHALPSRIGPYRLNDRYFVRLTLEVLGLPQQTIDVEVDWVRAIRALTP